jgi:predicted regulator of Ras-like GTPase activity (Roadblock/LC7/MglB family)
MYERILPHLNDLNNLSIDIEASALVSIDGLVIATTLPLYMDSDHIGAVCAGTFRLGYQTSEKCASGMMEQLMIKCTKNQLILIRVDEETILAVIIKPYANFEQIFPFIKYAIAKITAITAES